MNRLGNSCVGVWLMVSMVGCGAGDAADSSNATIGAMSATGAGAAGNAMANMGTGAAMNAGTGANPGGSGTQTNTNLGSGGGVNPGAGGVDTGGLNTSQGGNASPGAGGAAGQMMPDLTNMGGTGMTGTASGGVQNAGGGGENSGGSTMQGQAGAMQSENTGGQAPTQEPVIVDRPSLVTSGQNAFWQEGEVMEMPGGNPSVSVNEDQTYQEWLGFGGTFNEAGWDVLSLLDEAERTRAIKLLFDAAEGANFKFGRLPIGASDFAMDRYTLDDTPDDYMMESFSIDRDKEMLIPYIKAALAVKSDIYLWGSPWSPPAWMKDNNDINGGNMKSDQQVLEAYALYFARFIEEYAKEGLKIAHIEPQNEPGYETRYPSCLWSASLLTDFVGSYLGPTLESHNLDTEIWFGTMSAPEDTAHISAVLGNATARGYVKGFGLQWNVMSSTGSLAGDGFLVMQTEHKCGNYPWEGGFNSSQPPNDFAYATESWGLIRDWIQAGVNIYSAWNMVLDTQGQNLDEQRPWPQNALLVVDRNAKSLTATPAYYVFRHLSYFVDPGATRIGLSNSDGLAFKNPDGSIVAVLHNGGQASQVSLGVGGTTLQFQIPAQGWASVFWEG